MSFNDPIADMLTKIRNGQMAKLASVAVPFSKFHTSILNVLVDEGYIKSYNIEQIRPGVSQIKVFLSYHKNSGVIKKISKASTPGLRMYSSVKELKQKRYLSGLGIMIVSTSKGVMSDRQARALNVGGEVICNVY